MYICVYIYNHNPQTQEEMITRFQKAVATWSCPGGCKCGVQTCIPKP